MSAYPFEVDSSYIPWSSPDKYSLYTTNEMVTAGYPATIKAYTNAPAVQLDTGVGVFNATALNGVATFSLNAGQVTPGRYTLATIGGAKDSNAVYLQSYDLTSILRTGITGDDTGDQRWVFGFTSKVDRDAMKIFANGVPVPASPNEAEEPGWLLTYGASINTGYTSADADGSNQHAFFQENVPGFPATYVAGSNRVVRLEDVKLEALPGFSFQFSYDLNRSKTAGQAPSWPSTNIKVGPSPNWPEYPNKNTDTGNRPVSLPWPTTNLGEVTFNPNNDPITPDTNSVTIGFANPMDPQNFGFGTNFADNYTVTWNEAKTQATIGFDRPAAPGGELVLARLKDAAGNVNVRPYVYDLGLTAAVPTASLVVTTDVYAGANFSATLGLSQVTQAVYASDVQVSYDPALVEFAGADSLVAGTSVVGVDSATPGIVHVLVASQGADQAITADKDLLRLNWKAKLLTETETAAFRIVNATLSDGDTEIAAQTGAPTTVQIIYIDKAPLLSKISEAQALLNSATEGSGIGQYPAGSKAALQAAIDTANAAAGGPLSQQALQAAVDALAQALQAFKLSVISRVPGDVNGDGRVTVSDLAKVAQNYGKTSQSGDWAAVQAMDVNHDSVINIEDLSFIARKILGQ
jgi:hypothetical protein